MKYLVSKGSWSKLAKNSEINVQVPKGFIFDAKELPKEPAEPKTDDEQDEDDDIDGSQTSDEEEADEHEQELMTKLIEVHMFNVVDVDGDNRMDISEFTHAIRAMGCDPTPRELKKLHKKWDVGKSGYLELEEFNKTTEILGRRSVLMPNNVFVKI